ncbi:N-acetylmuramate/N-acetylglucosamine kinase [Georgfuchsia toluolica]|uniref:N-acetylmuramate/N-acetylglucosamine kinase n=1 Tax=Georgfuchsia toluolica TaxID=424218 RepID=A0A916J6L2_9PROT|nr:phosphotransferase [Georgfuchsia toluolica]CAG4884130.1 N-acetylmuramate/N-acetylglucosamine kinase [Georgfuchsia toluolica]
MQRQRAIEHWLARLFPGKAFSLAPASSDASFRRYFRVTWQDATTAIVMDAPPAHEDLHPWLQVQQLFHAAGAAVPDILARELEQGFLLISDLGATTYLDILRHATPQQAYPHYLAALDTLVDIQRASRAGMLPEYDRALLKRELDLFPDWYVARHLGVEMGNAQRQQLAAVFEKILTVNLAEPKVYVHRDYHSRNLMLPVAAGKPGVIDFQDAVYGPISYDLVSLLKDAYIEWEEEQALDWLIRYWEKARQADLPVNPDFAVFHRDYEWMGVQRHLKVLGIFARLYHRDGKDGYLKDMPLVAKYLRGAVSRYDELTPLRRLLDLLEDKVTVFGHTMPAGQLKAKP